jgi:hypothetical protein
VSIARCTDSTIALFAKRLGSRRAGLSQRLLNGPGSPPLSSIVGTQAVA